MYADNFGCMPGIDRGLSALQHKPPPPPAQWAENASYLTEHPAPHNHKIFVTPVGVLHWNRLPPMHIYNQWFEVCLPPFRKLFGLLRS